MTQPDKIFELQRLFISVAEKELPESSETSWNEYSILTYFWPSPCARMQGLWANVNEHEIMLATALSHTHIDKAHPDIRSVQTDDVPVRIVQQTVAEVLEIFSGETVFTKNYTPDGLEHSSSSMSPRWLWKDPHHRSKWTEYHGEGWSTRAWDWRGAIVD
ncbi:MAG: hypothetical protein R3E04_06910 [Sphingobium sp.]